MRPRIRFFIAGFLITGCIAVGAPPAVFAQDTPPIPKEQLQELQAIVKIQNAVEQINALGRFLAIYPETPLRADVYRLQFLSRKTLTGNDDELWNVGRRFVEAVTVLVDTRVPPPMRNPVLAQAYNEVAYEFSRRGTYLDEALSYSQQALALIKSSSDTPPNVTEDQWDAQLSNIRGQILDTLGWIQYKSQARQDAERALTDAADLLPDNGTVLYHLGMVHIALGHTDQAIDALLMAATVEKPEEEALNELDRVFKDKYGVSAGLQLNTQMQAAQTRGDARKMRKVVSNRLNTKAPYFSMTSLGGEAVDLTGLKGKVVIINFWATWCPPCRKEMPDLQSLWGSYQDQEDVVFMIASVDQEQGKVQPYIDANNYSFPVFYAGAAGQAYQVTSIPSTYVIDKTGSIQYVHVGYRPDIKDILTWEINALRKE
jgi:thiol-disulfide isomerase/thioredoxin